MQDLIPYILGYTLAFIIGVFITRAIFSIPKFLSLQKAQLQILTEIAIKQGVNPEVIRSIYTYESIDLREKTKEERQEALDKAKKSEQNTN